MQIYYNNELYTPYYNSSQYDVTTKNNNTIVYLTDNKNTWYKDLTSYNIVTSSNISGVTITSGKATDLYELLNTDAEVFVINIGLNEIWITEDYLTSVITKSTDKERNSTNLWKAYNYLIDTIKTLHPNARIRIILPTLFCPKDDEVLVKSLYNNLFRVIKTIQAIAEYNNVPYLDLNLEILKEADIVTYSNLDYTVKTSSIPVFDYLKSTSYSNDDTFNEKIIKFINPITLAIIGDSLSTFYSKLITDYCETGEYAPHYYSYADSSTLHSKNASYYENSCILDTSTSGATFSSEEVTLNTACKTSDGNAAKVISYNLGFDISGNGSNDTVDISVWSGCPKPTKAFTAEDTWWMKLANKLGVDSIVNCSWTGTRVSPAYGGTYDESSPKTACSNRRVADVGINGEPEYICVFMGTNDLYTIITKGEELAVPHIITYYTILLDRLKVAYPNSKVICMNPIYDPDNVGYVLFAAALKELVNSYNYIYVNLNDSLNITEWSWVSSRYTFCKTKGVVVSTGNETSFYQWNGHYNSELHTLISNAVYDKMNSENKEDEEEVPVTPVTPESSYTIDPNDILIKTYNMGHLSAVKGGTSDTTSGITAATKNEFQGKYKAVINNTFKSDGSLLDSRLPDIFGVQEYNSYFVKNNWDATNKTYNVIFDNYLLSDGTTINGAIGTLYNYSFNAVFIKPEIGNVDPDKKYFYAKFMNSSIYPTGATFNAIRLIITINGKEVAVVSTHINPMYAADYNAVRYLQALKLIELTKDYQYAVIMMDSNSTKAMQLNATTETVDKAYSNIYIAKNTKGNTTVSQQCYGFRNAGFSCTLDATDRNSSGQQTIWDTDVDAILVKGFEVILSGKINKYTYNGTVYDASNGSHVANDTRESLSDHCCHFARVKMKLYD